MALLNLAVLITVLIAYGMISSYMINSEIENNKFSYKSEKIKTDDQIKMHLQEVIDNFAMKHIFLLPIVIIISGLLGSILGKALIKPVDKITTIVDEINSTNLSGRLPECNSGDEIEHLTNTFNHMLDRLEESFNQVRRFTSDASHELKTPLTILRGELELALHNELPTEKYQIVLASALDEVIRLTNVVQTLLELSRADSGQIPMAFQKENLSKLLNDITEDAEILAEVKNISVQSSIEQDIFIEFDIARLHQAVLNLVDNAIKYTPEDGFITIELKRFNQSVIISIRDTGIGIPNDHFERIFDRFYRLDKVVTSNIPGSGLGLSIVNWIVNAHNGKIWVQSKLDVGTSFMIELPYQQA